MTRRTTRSWLFGLALPLAALGGYSCGSSSESPGEGGAKPSGTECSSDGECGSGTCTGGACAPGTSLPDGTACSAASECASDACTDGRCGTSTSGGPDASTGGGGTGSGAGGTSGTGATGSGTGATGSGVGGTGSTPPGGTCSVGSDCTSGLCTDGTCTAVGPGGTPTTGGPHFDGTGSGFRPLTAGCGPDTANECTGTCEQAGGDPNVDVIRPPATLCFSGEGDLTPDDPAVVIEQSIETLNGKTYVHLRVTFDPSFVDNTYGTGSVGWNPRRPHTFERDLTTSDHTELLLTDGTGETAANFKIDFVTADPSQPCGFGTLGVEGGDGSVIDGDPAHILALSTSISRNLNGCGYCENAACEGGDCTVNSPATDEDFTANAGTPNWDYRAVYEVWIDIAAFGDAGFGQAFMTYVHASPAKSSSDTLELVPTPCPPTWDVPYCPPSVAEEGGSCFGSPPGTGGAGGGGGYTGAGGAGGAGGGGGYTGAGGSTTGTPTPCPVNYQIYVSSEGQSTCTPIPFANYPGMTPCPAGYTLDVASEGRYCLPNP